MLDMRGVLGLFLVFALALPVRGETEHILDTTKEGMEKIANDLGVKCEYCHPKVKTDGKRDFAAPSEMKTRIDSCHSKPHARSSDENAARSFPDYETADCRQIRTEGRRTD